MFEQHAEAIRNGVEAEFLASPVSSVVLPSEMSSSSSSSATSTSAAASDHDSVDSGRSSSSSSSSSDRPTSEGRGTRGANRDLHFVGDRVTQLDRLQKHFWFPLHPAVFHIMDKRELRPFGDSGLLVYTPPAPEIVLDNLLCWMKN